MAFPGRSDSEVLRAEISWWRDRVRETFRAADQMQSFSDFGAFFDRVYDRFAAARAWRVIDGESRKGSSDSPPAVIRSGPGLELRPAAAGDPDRTGPRPFLRPDPAPRPLRLRETRPAHLHPRLRAPRPPARAVHLRRRPSRTRHRRGGERRPSGDRRRHFGYVCRARPTDRAG